MLLCFQSHLGFEMSGIRSAPGAILLVEVLFNVYKCFLKINVTYFCVCNIVKFFLNVVYIYADNSKKTKKKKKEEEEWWKGGYTISSAAEPNSK